MESKMLNNKFFTTTNNIDVVIDDTPIIHAQTRTKVSTADPRGEEFPPIITHELSEYIPPSIPSTLTDEELAALNLRRMDDSIPGDLEMYDKYMYNMRAENVNKLVVTTASGKEFNGDEKSQDRMLRAIQIAELVSETTTKWKLADNSIVDVSLSELKEALSLSGRAMSDIWLGIS